MPRPKPDPTPIAKPNIVINVNQLVADLQMGVRHDEMSPFAFAVELAQARGTEFYWRAYVTCGGRVRASSKLESKHETPGGAINELWALLTKDG